MSIDFEFSRDLRAALDEMQRLKPVEVTVGTNLSDPPYPYFLEFGTSRMYARPSARPAFEEAKGAAVDAAADTLGQQFAQKHFTQGGMRTAGRVAGLIIANRWKQLAPVETGTYRGSIHVEIEDVR